MTHPPQHQHTQPQRSQVDLGSSSVVNSEKLRRLKLRLGRLRPGLAFTYESL